MWPGLKPTCVPSFILIHPTVWPQYTNVTDRETDRTDRQTDNGLIAQGEPFYKRSPKKRKAGADPEFTAEECSRVRIANTLLPKAGTPLEGSEAGCKEIFFKNQV